MNGRSRTDVGLLALRLALGATMAVHGAQKLFGWFGGPGIKGTAAGMEKMGYQPAQISAVAAGLGEAGGGALLALGLATPVGGAAVAATMASAAAVHAPGGFFATEGGLEYQVVLAATGAALAVTGPGRFSLDARFGNRLNRPWMAVAALTSMAAAATAIQIRRRRHLSVPADDDSAQPA
jgi:putative oxidoreductase